MNDIELLKYPIGKLSINDEYSESEIAGFIETINELPGKLSELIEGADDEFLNKTYREGSWTVKQVVHHIADSHLNAFIRLKLALTEDNPTIKPYSQSLWAETFDGKDSDINASLKIIEGTHQRMADTLRNLSESDFDRTYYHPETGKNVKISQLIALYAWHSKHHIGHILSIKEQ
jgi:exoribonuclease II